jgi:hypothetical protein
MTCIGVKARTKQKVSKNQSTNNIIRSCLYTKLDNYLLIHIFSTLKTLRTLCKLTYLTYFLKLLKTNIQKPLIKSSVYLDFLYSFIVFHIFLWFFVAFYNFSYSFIFFHILL